MIYEIYVLIPKELKLGGGRAEGEERGEAEEEEEELEEGEEEEGEGEEGAGEEENNILPIGLKVLRNLSVNSHYITALI